LGQEPDIRHRHIPMAHVWAEILGDLVLSTRGPHGSWSTSAPMMPTPLDSRGLHCLLPRRQSAEPSFTLRVRTETSPFPQAFVTDSGAFFRRFFSRRFADFVPFFWSRCRNFA
jgi:hypothetical protein